MPTIPNYVAVYRVRFDYYTSAATTWVAGDKDIAAKRNGQAAVDLAETWLREQGPEYVSCNFRVRGLHLLADADISEEI